MREVGRDLGNESLLKPRPCCLGYAGCWPTLFGLRYSPLLWKFCALFALPRLSTLITSFCE